MPEVELSWLTPRGLGAGKEPGKKGVLQVAGGLPGETVTYEPSGQRGSTRFGALRAIKNPSKHRRVPSCPWDATCGGCDLSFVEPEHRLELLGGVVQRLLKWPARPEVVASPLASGHRARITLAITEHGLGYHVTGSNDLVAIESCAVARPEIQRAHQQLRAWMAEHTDMHASFRSVELRSDGTRVVYSFLTQRTPARRLRQALADLGDVAIDGQAIHGNPTLRLASTCAQLRASPLSFYQVNLEVNRQLVRTAQQWIREQQPERLLDLYCGIGNMSCGLWAEVPTVGIENEGQAIEDCRATAVELDVQHNLTTHACAAQSFDFSSEAFDVALIDPPRSGTDGVVERILRNRPRALIYVSCNLAAAVSDLRSAQAKGYAITQVKCFDMFPDTHHLETILLLQRT